MVAGSNLTFQPLGALPPARCFRPAPAGIGDDDRDRTLLGCDGARAEQPITAGHPAAAGRRRRAQVGLGGSVLGVDRDLDRKCRRRRSRRPDLQLDVLGLAGLDRDRGQFLAAIGLGERGFEIVRRFRGEAATRLRPLSFLMVRGYSKFDLGLPRSEGSSMSPSAWRAVPWRAPPSTGSARLVPWPSAFTVRVCASDRRWPGHRGEAAAHAGVRRRHRRRDRLAAAQQGRGPAARHAGDRKLVSLRRRARSSAGAAECSRWCPASP